jgi:hypothetical protein
MVREGNSGGHRSHACTAVMCTKCIKTINTDVMRLFHGESVTATAAGMSVDPAAVPKYHKGGAYFIPLRGFRGHAAHIVLVADIDKSF